MGCGSSKSTEAISADHATKKVDKQAKGENIVKAKDNDTAVSI